MPSSIISCPILDGSRAGKALRFSLALLAVTLAPAALPAQSLERAVVVPMQRFAVNPGRLVPAVSVSGRGIAIGTTDQQIIIFDSLGRENRRLGRAGSGPGEFQRLMTLGAIGDTLFALDAVRRVTTFNPDGLATTKTVQLPTGGTIPLGARLLSGREIILAQSAQPGQPEIEARGQLIVRGTADGRILDTLGALDIRDQVIRIPLGPGSEAQIFPPFVELDRVAVTGRGGWLAIVRATDSQFNRDDRTNVIEFFGPKGHSLVKVPAVTHALRDATVSRWLDVEASKIARNIPAGQSGARRAISSHFVRPPTHPSIRAAVMGDDGVLWLLQSPTDAPHETWTLLQPTGVSLGSVTLPDGSRPVSVSGSGAWVVHERNDGEMELVRYRVRR